jgi:hypothetical protein
VTDYALHRTDQLLSELIEIVETARALPMSTSCVLPRERMLDLLDELRDVMPPEMEQARRVIGNRDELVQAAGERAELVREEATAAAAAIVADANQRAEQVLAAATAEAEELGEGARIEHARLVSATAVHQAAAESAADLREQARRYAGETELAADQYAATARAEADAYVQQLRHDAERQAQQLTTGAVDYADRTLAELAASLHKAAATTDQGRAARAERQNRVSSAA